MFTLWVLLHLCWMTPLTCSHVYLLFRNITTNESMNWQRYAHPLCAPLPHACLARATYPWFPVKLPRSARPTVSCTCVFVFSVLWV
jgi:hypothetical protein